MKEISEKQKDNEKIHFEEIIKRGKIIFIVGTIIIVLAVLVLYADTGLRIYSHYYEGYFAMMAYIAYFFGLLLVVYSIHLVRNKWGWLDCPIFIVFPLIVNIFAPNLSVWEMPLPFRLIWLLIFPLNYVALLILFLASIKKVKTI